MQFDPSILRLAAGIPGAGIGGLLGLATGKKGHRWENASRGAGIGYLTGTGLGVGAELGSRGDSPIAGQLAGGLAGGLAGYGAGTLMQGPPKSQERQKFREELLAVLKEEQNKLRSELRAPIHNLQKIGEELPALARYAEDNPAMSVIPISGIAGAALANKKQNPIINTLRGAALGLATGTGAVAGGTLGSRLTNDTAGTLGGGALGGLLTYLATRNLLHPDYEKKEKREKYGISPALQQLIQAKELSDRRDYKGKHARLRNLMERYPDDFVIDSQYGDIVGITHKSGFKIHAPSRILPQGLRRLSNDDMSQAA